LTLGDYPNLSSIAKVWFYYRGIVKRAEAITTIVAGRNWMDPAMGIVGAILVFRWSWGLLRATSSASSRRVLVSSEFAKA